MFSLSSVFSPVEGYSGYPLNKLGQFGLTTLNNGVDIGERVSSLEVVVLYLQHISLRVESRGKLLVTEE